MTLDEDTILTSWIGCLRCWSWIWTSAFNYSYRKSGIVSSSVLWWFWSLRYDILLQQVAPLLWEEVFLFGCPTGHQCSFISETESLQKNGNPVHFHDVYCREPQSIQTKTFLSEKNSHLTFVNPHAKNGSFLILILCVGNGPISYEIS